MAWKPGRLYVYFSDDIGHFDFEGEGRLAARAWVDILRA